MCYTFANAIDLLNFRQKFQIPKTETEIKF